MKITVIIPVFNEEKYILKVLKNVNSFKNKLNLEILVSDDGSTDKTLTILKKMKIFMTCLLKEKKIKEKDLQLKML